MFIAGLARIRVALVPQILVSPATPAYMGSSENMNCPKCNRPLEATRIRGTEVDHCSKCRGIWFDERELSNLLELSPTELRPIRGGKVQDDVNRIKAKCPRDQAVLMRVSSALKPGIIVDSCPDCRGIWLDGGELDSLLP